MSGNSAKTVRFGLNISTSVIDGYDPVRTARRAEQLGFDFVSSSDHPGGDSPNYETWTMLTWVAAATTRIQIGTRVLCVPFRLPALTAKMAETLQRLSNGRLILGLGGGYSDDEMRSYGLSHRTPRDKVDGLEEAIRIMHGLWTEPNATFDGRLYRTDHAWLEPKPATPVPIWLGTYGKNALELTGRLGDGWIPSYGLVPPEVAIPMRDRVRTAAADAGRDPDDVTCAYHLQVRAGEQLDDPTIVSGGAAHLVCQFVGFANIGFTTLSLALVGPNEDEQLDLLGSEVLPAVRSALG
jgi:alkanesulfonate monooxygenase SsuD/methylene tetrahydromethanopterin reductase-like flavin-dependent oxidoreductase (luciferase family)